MTAMTTVGFNTISISQISRASLLVLTILMVIGASPSGTGSGLKTTTFSALVGVMRSTMREDREVRFWNRLVPLERVWTAVASLGFYLFTLVAGLISWSSWRRSSSNRTFLRRPRPWAPWG
jgi:trk system potassium uptake protein TrkH